MNEKNKRNHVTDFYFRAANETDINQLHTLSGVAQPGLTSIPKSKKIWAERIQKSIETLGRTHIRPN